MINYTRHYIDAADIHSVTKVLRSNFLTQGIETRNFEDKLKKKFNCNYVCVLSSGTAALHLCGIALGWKKNDIIIVPAITFVASANAALFREASVEFIDIDKDFYTIDVAKVEERIIFLKKKKKNIKAIIATDYAGQPCDWFKLREISKKYKLQLINDNCHALGAKYFGMNNYATKFADVVIQSFHPAKNITTGEGGAIFTNKKNIYEKIKILRSHGIIRSNYWNYNINDLGFNYRITDFQCALGSSQLNKLNKFLHKKKKIALLYNRLLANHKLITCPRVRPGSEHAFHLYPVKINFSRLNIKKINFLKSLRKKNINLQIHYKPINSFQLHRNSSKNLKVANQYYKQTLSLPIYYKLSFENVRFITKTIINLVNKYCKKD